MRHWLVKTEPESFSFDDLLAEPGQTTPWEGVRNYQARNFMKDEMRPGDPVLFYHSGVNPPGVAGLAEVASEAYADPTQFDEASAYYDPKAMQDGPRWWLVDIRALRRLPRFVTLGELRADAALQDMRLVQRGNRLSVMPVTEVEFERVLRLSER